MFCCAEYENVCCSHRWEGVGSVKPPFWFCNPECSRVCVCVCVCVCVRERERERERERQGERGGGEPPDSKVRHQFRFLRASKVFYTLWTLTHSDLTHVPTGHRSKSDCGRPGWQINDGIICQKQLSVQLIGCKLDGPRVDYRQGWNNFFLSKKRLLPWKKPEREADHRPPSSAAVNSALSVATALLH